MSLEKMLRRKTQWHTSFLTIAFLAALAQRIAPLKLFQRATANMLSMPTPALNAVLAQIHAPSALPKQNNLT